MITSLESMGRRSVLRSAVSGLGAAVLAAGTSGCAPGGRNAPMSPQELATSPSAQDTPVPGQGGRVLLAYFSRAGENYFYGGRTNLDVLRFAHFLALAILTVRFIPRDWPYLKSSLLRPAILCGQHWNQDAK